MDSYGRMGLSSHKAVVSDRQARLTQEAAEARLLRAASHDDVEAPVHERQGFLRRLVSAFGVHGHRARRVTRDVLQAPASGTAPFRTLEHPGR
jgi:hypothetical protein